MAIVVLAATSHWYWYLECTDATPSLYLLHRQFIECGHRAATITVSSKQSAAAKSSSNSSSAAAKNVFHLTVDGVPKVPRDDEGQEAMPPEDVPMGSDVLPPHRG